MSERDNGSGFGAELNRRELLRNAGVLGVSLSAAGGLLSACGSASTTAGTTAANSAGTPRSGGVLRFARNQEPTSLNPVIPSDNGSAWEIQQIFDQLVEVAPSGYDPVPGLAESWTISQDSLTYTFKLREAVFSNGEPVTSEDVKFSLERFANPKVNINYAMLGAAIKAVSAPDPSTVVVHLKHVEGPMLPYLTVFAASIVPKKVVTAMGETAFGRKPVGSGPFMLKSWKQGQAVEMVRNPHYWKKGMPYLDGVTFTYVADDNTRVLALQSGQYEVAESVPYSQIAQLSGGNGTRIQFDQLASVDQIVLNNRKAPLTEQSVRQALNYATPKEAILKSIYLNDAQIANSLLPKNKYWDSSIKPYPFDMEKAKSLLASSSVPDGFKTSMLIVSGDSVKAQVAAILQEEWAKIGIHVDVTQVDQGTMGTRFTGGDYDMVSFPVNNLTSDVMIDDELATLLLDYNGGLYSYFTWYRSAKAEKLIREAGGTTDETARRKLFSELQQLALDDSPMVTLYFTPARTGLGTNVQQFITVPTGWWKLEKTWLSA